MKKFLKIVAIVAVVLIAVALVVPLALKSKVGDIVKKEAGELGSPPKSISVRST